MINGLEEFIKSNYSLYVINNQKEIYKSTEKGVMPLVKCILSNKADLVEATVYDKLIGNAAAFLLIYASVKEINTPLCSESALKTLSETNIKIEYSKTVSRVLNRDKSDICLMEKLSYATNSPEDFFLKAKEKLGL